ncbi:hypothetical protein M405DRAFT_866812 [Rhizopogon salebrosus TDB-379]|nr:hypothetical protein M405DRAFT_866812 [Rhizopogon salebrosus TDB-379]
MVLGSVIDASDAFGVSRRSSPDAPELARVIDASNAFRVNRRSLPVTPNLVSSSPVSPIDFDISLLCDVHLLDVAR